MIVAQICGIAAVEVVGGLLCMCGLRDIIYAWTSPTWPMYDGKVTYVRYRPGRYGDQSYFSIQYDYEVGGALYRGRRIQVMNFSTMADAWYGRYTEGLIVSVYAHPRRPRFAVLEPGMSHPMAYLFFPLLGTAFMVSAALMLRHLQ